VATAWVVLARRGIVSGLVASGGLGVIVVELIGH